MSTKLIAKLVVIIAVSLLMATIAVAEELSYDVSIESEHPYPNDIDEPEYDYQYIWDIEYPEATQMRLHFEQLELGPGDYLYLLDEDGKEIRDFSRFDDMDGAWTEWYQMSSFRLKLDTNSEENGYGFKINEIEIRTDMHPESEYAESYHPYANNLVDTWLFEDSNSTQMRIHFKKSGFASYNDELHILDEDDNVLFKYYNYPNLEETWTDWYSGSVLKLMLVTSDSSTDYGFLVDDIETRSDDYPESEYAETYHPYANNIDGITWDFESPDATQMRLHFEKFELEGFRDNVYILDEYNKELARFSISSNEVLDGEWTEWYEVNHLRIRFVTDSRDTAYGFKIDAVEPEPGVIEPVVAPEVAEPVVTPEVIEPIDEEQTTAEFKVTVISSTETSPQIEVKEIVLVADSDGNYRLVGEATDSDEVAYILINGIKVSDSGLFDTELTLQGDSVDIEAVDTNGEATKINVQIALLDDSDDSSLGIIDNILGILVSLGAIVGVMFGVIKSPMIKEKLFKKKN
jgi:hypothetical protein